MQMVALALSRCAVFLQQQHPFLRPPMDSLPSIQTRELSCSPTSGPLTEMHAMQARNPPMTTVWHGHGLLCLGQPGVVVYP